MLILISSPCKMARMISYYVYPGLKMECFTAEEFEGMRRQNSAYHTPAEIIAEIRRCICEFFDVTMEQLEGPRGNMEVCWARHVYVTMLRKYAQLSLKTVADSINRDHTTIMHSEKRVKEETETYPEMSGQLTRIESKIEDSLYLTIGKSKGII